MPTNTFGQCVGEPLPGFIGCPFPPSSPLDGGYTILEPLNVEAHASALYTSFCLSPDDRDWTYLFFDRPPDLNSFIEWLNLLAADSTLIVMVVHDKSLSLPTGLLSFMRIKPRSGVLEIGHVIFSSLLQRTRCATEAIYLMIKRAFDSGYRRVEWKCDALNERSKSAALRLGFSYEGNFRNAFVYKSRTRDTAWFSIIDTDWGALNSRLSGWLRKDNFCSISGHQIRPLSAFTV